MVAPNLLSSFPARICLALMYLIAVNLGSGLLAVELGYPSLWGASEVFHEYAYPALYNWALVHTLSMLPLAWLVFRLPTLRPRHIRLCQIASLASLVLLFFVEVKLPYGKLRHIPFALFLIVDALVLLSVALLLRPPWKLLAGFALLLALISTVYFGPPDIARDFTFQSSDNLEDNPEATPKKKAAKKFFAEVTEYQRKDYIEYLAVVQDTVGPDLGPGKREICREANRLVASGTQDVVILMVHPWFEPETKYIYKAGTAGYYGSSIWRCHFELPERRD